MKPRFTLVVAILTLATAMGLVSPAAADKDTALPDEPQAKPQVEIEEPEVVFGETSKGTQLTHDYIIRNTGNAPLEITRVVPACGCTVADYDEVIPAGGEGKIHIVVDTKELEGPSRRAIRVFTNDPSQSTLVLFIEVDVKRYVNADPGYARYQVVHGEEAPGVIRQTVYSTDDKDFQITKVESPFSFLEMTYHRATAEERKEQIKSNTQWIVSLNLKYNEAPVGPLSGIATVYTDHPVQPELQLPVSGFVRPAMWVTPHEVVLGEVDLADRGATFSIVVQNFLSDPMEITRVESDFEGAESSFSPIQEGRKYSVRVVMTPEVPKGKLQGTLVIHTNNEKTPTLEVPVTGIIH